MYEGEEICVQDFCGETDHFVDPGLDERIILKSFPFNYSQPYVDLILCTQSDSIINKQQNEMDQTSFHSDLVLSGRPIYLE